MFWHLLFAHFLADYPLQSNWIATNKDKLPVLALHAGIHLAAMLVMSGPAAGEVWPYLLALAAIHMSIDALKVRLTARRQEMIVLPYLIDQGLHYLTIAATSWWVLQRLGPLTMLFEARLAVLATGLLLTTHVAFISERVLMQRNPAYIKEVIRQRWPRNVARAILWGSLVWIITPQALLAGGLAASAYWPYLSGKFARRALLTDLLIVLVSLLFVQGAFLALNG